MTSIVREAVSRARCVACGVGVMRDYWDVHNFGPEPALSIDVSVAVRLDCPAIAVWFVAGMPRLPDRSTAFIPADEIMVVFSPDKMRAMGFDDATFLRRAG
jgi:hypothetical protein